MEENKNYKRYIYISKEVQPIMEEFCSKQSIILVTRFINEYNLEKFMQTELRNLNSVDYLIIDLKAIENLTSDEEIIKKITLMRKMYNLRIIIMAEGYKQGNLLLGKIFNLGIYNIITGTDDMQFKAELEKCFSDEGMSFGNALKYKVDNGLIAVNQTTKLIKENYIKVKQIVSIGIASTERHLGATTICINLLEYLRELQNIKACYIENNNNGSIISIVENEDSVYSKETGKITYRGIELFLKPKTMSDILSCNYSFYIYDYGALNQMTDEERNSYMTRDLKILVAGNKIWEIQNLIEAFKVIGEDPSTYLLFNFVDNGEKESFKKSLGDFWQNKSEFSEIILNPFEVKNKGFYEKILKPYLLQNEIVEKKKFSFWRKLKK